VDSLDIHGTTCVCKRKYNAALTGRFKQFVLLVFCILFLEIKCMFPLMHGACLSLLCNWLEAIVVFLA
jgi:hypothetical protein